MAAQIIPVIMCGGAGTRLWPVSRESMPKQFVPLVGHESTFKQVLARITDPELFARPIVITKADFRFVVAEQLREHGIETDIVLEPMRRPGARSRYKSTSTGRSIGWSSKELLRSRLAMTCAPCTKTSRAISRSEAFIGLPIRARFRSN
jgi:hypothetical protein